MKYIKQFLIVLSILFLNSRIQPVLADINVDMSGNGNNTQNSVTATNTQTTEVYQTNNAQTENNVSQTADSGNNNVSSNSGSAQITTGNINEQTTVNNDLNFSDVTSNNCCKSSVEVNVSGNGTNSENQVIVTSNKNVSIEVNSSAVAANDLKVAGVSGHNVAGDNNGDIAINTGNIEVNGLVNNAVNSSDVEAGIGSGDIFILNKNNGTQSLNNININLDDEFNFQREQNADIYNNFIADISTGGNKTLTNLGDVFIGTGDVELSFNLINAPINEEYAVSFCCDNGTPVNPPNGDGDGDADGKGNGDGGIGGQENNPGNIPPTGGTTVSSSNNTSGGSSSSLSDGSSVGQTLASLAQILPATGASAFHFWIYSVVYLLIFLSGLYLRLRAGRSPDYTSAYAYSY